MIPSTTQTKDPSLIPAVVNEYAGNSTGTSTHNGRKISSDYSSPSTKRSNDLGRSKLEEGNCCKDCCQAKCCDDYSSGCLIGCGMVLFCTVLGIPWAIQMIMKGGDKWMKEEDKK